MDRKENPASEAIMGKRQACLGSLSVLGWPRLRGRLAPSQRARARLRAAGGPDPSMPTHVPGTGNELEGKKLFPPRRLSALARVSSSAADIFSALGNLGGSPPPATPQGRDQKQAGGAGKDGRRGARLSSKPTGEPDAPRRPPQEHGKVRRSGSEAAQRSHRDCLERGALPPASRRMRVVCFFSRWGGTA
jgi:hypothetical protein